MVAGSSKHFVAARLKWDTCSCHRHTHRLPNVSRKRGYKNPWEPVKVPYFGSTSCGNIWYVADKRYSLPAGWVSRKEPYFVAVRTKTMAPFTRPLTVARPLQRKIGWNKISIRIFRWKTEEFYFSKINWGSKSKLTAIYLSNWYKKWWKYQ